MSKKVTIEIPEDCELFPDGVGKWELRKLERKLPKTWEEFCRMNPFNNAEHFIRSNSEIGTFALGRERDVEADKNSLPNRRLAEAMLALCQLIQLMNCYNGDWKPDWADSESWKYNIESGCDKIICSMSKTDSCVLAFQTMDLRDQFLENFRELIEIAKPLI